MQKQDAKLNSIFVSYRRSDSSSDSGRLYDYLERHFGRDRVFKDVDSIPLGVNFRNFLEQQVSRCHVMIVVIGSGWLAAVDEDGVRKLDKSDDWVRIEIESALHKGIPIIPLLVGSAGIPNMLELPESLRPLVDWQSLSVRPDPDFRSDVRKLLNGVENLFSKIDSSDTHEAAYSSIKEHHLRSDVTRLLSQIGDLFSNLNSSLAQKADHPSTKEHLHNSSSDTRNSSTSESRTRFTTNHPRGSITGFYRGM